MKKSNNPNQPSKIRQFPIPRKVKSERDPLEILLRDSLAPVYEAPEKAQEHIRERMEQMKNKRKKFNWQKVTAIAVASLLMLSAVVYAATNLLSPKEIVEEMSYEGDMDKIIEALDKGDAIEINQSQEYGDYTVSLLSIVAGKDLIDSPFEESLPEHPGEFYLIAAISRTDGKPIIDDPVFGRDGGVSSLSINPLITGFSPMQANIASLGGSGRAIFREEATYHLRTMDNILIFADRGIKISVMERGIVPSADDIIFDRETGEHTLNPDAKGLNMLFDLDLDPALGDPEKAAAFIDKNEAMSRPLPKEMSEEELEKEVQDREQKIKNEMEVLAALEEEPQNELCSELWEKALELLDENKDQILRFSVEELKDGFAEELPEYEWVDTDSVEFDKLIEEEDSLYMYGSMEFPKQELRMGLYYNNRAEMQSFLGEANSDGSSLLSRDTPLPDYEPYESSYLIAPMILGKDRGEKLNSIKTGDSIIINDRVLGTAFEYKVTEVERFDHLEGWSTGNDEIAIVIYDRIPKTQLEEDMWTSYDDSCVILKATRVK